MNQATDRRTEEYMARHEEIITGIHPKRTTKEIVADLIQVRDTEDDKLSAIQALARLRGVCLKNRYGVYMICAVSERDFALICVAAIYTGLGNRFDNASPRREFAARLVQLITCGEFGVAD